MGMCRRQQISSLFPSMKNEVKKNPIVYKYISGKRKMNKYVIIQRWDQSVDSTVRAVRGSVGICFDAA